MADGDEPSAMTGGYFEQARLVQQTEDIQNYRRPQEGRLIIADDRPLLIMEEGTKFDGLNGAKYKIDGKFDIPIDYKVIVKWEEDEIVFMTRKGSYGPEFQIIYLPKSPVDSDFTLFEWNPNMQELWDQLLTVAEGKDGRDLKLFSQGPWATFGVTRDEVQIALKQDTGKQTKVDGILYAKYGQSPELPDYLRYLGFDPDKDSPYQWVYEAFMDEPLPPGYQQWVDKDQRVYWSLLATSETTWNHPNKDKYRKMLHAAREQKPVAARASVMAFRIEFLLSQHFPWECEATGEYPPVETVENVLEMARVFNVDIQKEPYFVHVLKRALRHYGNVVIGKRKVTDVKDFKHLLYRSRDLVEQFRREKDEEALAASAKKVCCQCPGSPRQRKDAVLFCDQCKDLFCQSCFDKLHSRGRRLSHRRTWVEMGQCAECNESIADFHCVQCSDLYCRDCFQEWHVRGGRRNHIPIVLRSIPKPSHKREGGEDERVDFAPKAALVVEKSMSEWFSFEDENGIVFYHNIETGASQRDRPMKVINEPVGDDVGGGLSSGWAGSWAGNMFTEQYLAQDMKAKDKPAPVTAH